MSGENNPKAFESIKQIGGKGREFWYARDLQEVLGHQEFPAFEQELMRAVEMCNANGVDAKQHVVGVQRVKEIEGIKCKVRDYILSRFACYLTVKDNESTRKIVGYGRAYFAGMAQGQETSQDAFNELEARKRLFLRPELAENNKLLSSFIEYGGANAFKTVFDEGYKGLYDGRSAAEVREAMGLSSGREVFDYMYSEGLAANLSKTKLAVSEIKKQDFGEMVLRKYAIFITKQVMRLESQLTVLAVLSRSCCRLPTRVSEGY